MRGAVAVGLALVASGAMADVSGSRDLEMLPRFPGSEIVVFSENPSVERIYPQGSIRRISGRLRYEREVQTTGAMTALTYELPRTHTATDVFTAAREAMQEQDAELLYWCQGRECGASNLWANSVFGQALLYGADDQQAYALLRLAEPQQDSLLALYSITRGNRRAYLHAELLASEAPLQNVLPTPATLLRQLKTDGELRLPAQVEPGDAWVELLARSLSLDSTLRVSLSGPQAEAWREALVAQRVRAARLELGNADAEGLRLTVLR